MSFRPPKTLPILSIFHNSRNGASRQALELLQKQQQRPSGQDAYRVDIIGDDTLPTKDQLQQLSSYLHGWKNLASEQQQDSTIQDTQQALLKDPMALKRPLVVDWQRGAAATSTNTIQALVQHRLDSK
ncbi:hypothetical protein BCR42DRAFT_469636 [Absidia repens]|uniref:Thioredoxin-like protein n=1 Tax=Absidia repens TaxID=90262 RepID=A0A1X2I6Z5_9FUNG|nr:hypothetical protein BCR42DRAFT_469636 [Absidia repens]